ncbi:hypothetical protein VOLCADRAFT_98168 [Volvox carteri f. nagariensis]|uniref:Methyltransferase FkbM domain-containing protein n=1 Tax=Volvox carteri f. nagariensis TaxID=3068 RepID=D8UEM3_VOLCA|nr:uncharacterized protein VOLCADRAFT_98168 [Volvox carteri f. nagariensis]EFJ41791.1 hypothetical protein VOLCADRAFT_98168 [Volvox carteri f. nagariensis]|eukprot:XP_002957137.1 hypothetical protein VOLCADRAFT_98168 [Volvox carteri f. nagariensis]
MEAIVTIAGWLLLALISGSFQLTSTAISSGSWDQAAAKLMRPHARRNLRNAGDEPPAWTMCLDTCNKARNEVCEEGRPGKVPVKITQFMAYCDLGWVGVSERVWRSWASEGFTGYCTDCTDCGPWSTSAVNVTWQDPKVVGPVRFLKARDLQVRVREAAVHPSIQFKFAYTNPEQDFDVSYHMDGSGIVEAGITTIVYQVLAGRCLREDGSRALVVDVGANFGWFAVLAARMGCRVIAFEPVPLFRSFLEYNIHLNDLSNLVEVRSSVVSHESGTLMKMVVPARGIWGTAGIDGLNIDTAIESRHQTIDVPSVRLEDEIKSDVLLLKVDVEGWEWSVMQGAAGLLRGYLVENVIMEYSPGAPERHFKWDHMLAHPAMLYDMITKYGFRIGHIGDADKHISAGWDAPLPPLREVTLENLKYDIEDVKRWQEGKLACPVPPNMANFSSWRLCGGVPEGLNPRSFRSNFGHNTNIWAAKTTSASGGSSRTGPGAGAGAGAGAALFQLEGVSGILAPTDPADKYFQTNSDAAGMGGRICRDLDPQVQVKHRCPCSKQSVCGEEEQEILKAVAAGTVPQNYVLK